MRKSVSLRIERVWISRAHNVTQNNPSISACKAKNILVLFVFPFFGFGGKHNFLVRWKIIFYGFDWKIRCCGFHVKLNFAVLIEKMIFFCVLVGRHYFQFWWKSDFAALVRKCDENEILRFCRKHTILRFSRKM